MEGDLLISTETGHLEVLADLLQLFVFGLDILLLVCLLVGSDIGKLLLLEYLNLSIVKVGVSLGMFILC